MIPKDIIPKTPLDWIVLAIVVFPIGGFTFIYGIITGATRELHNPVTVAKVLPCMLRDIFIAMFG